MTLFRGLIIETPDGRVRSVTCISSEMSQRSGRNIVKPAEATGLLPLGSTPQPHFVRQLITMFLRLTDWTKPTATAVPQIPAALLTDVKLGPRQKFVKCSQY
jgi:hypothetical protein